MARHSRGVCVVFVCALLAPSAPSTYYVVCRGVHMPMQNCVCAGRGGHISVCTHQVCWLLRVYVLYTPT